MEILLNYETKVDSDVRDASKSIVTGEEMVKASSKTRNCKSGQLVSEMLKGRCEFGRGLVYRLCNRVMTENELPEDESIIVSVYAGKGEPHTSEPCRTNLDHGILDVLFQTDRRFKHRNTWKFTAWKLLYF